MAKKNWLNLNGETLALSLLSAGEASHSFSAFLPSRFTIRNWVICGEADEVRDNIANLRSGYKPAVLFGMGLASVVSVIAKSVLPRLFSAGTSLAMIKLYEAALPPELQLKNPLDFLSLTAPNIGAAPAMAQGGETITSVAEGLGMMGI